MLCEMADAASADNARILAMLNLSPIISFLFNSEGKLVQANKKGMQKYGHIGECQLGVAQGSRCWGPACGLQCWALLAPLGRQPAVWITCRAVFNGTRIVPQVPTAGLSWRFPCSSLGSKSCTIYSHDKTVSRLQLCSRACLLQATADSATTCTQQLRLNNCG